MPKIIYLFPSSIENSYYLFSEILDSEKEGVRYYYRLNNATFVRKPAVSYLEFRKYHGMKGVNEISFSELPENIQADYLSLMKEKSSIERALTFDYSGYVIL